MVKKGNLTDICLLGAGTGSDDRTDIDVADNAIFFQNEVSNDRDMKKTTALLRDVGSWYHIVVAIDLTASSNDDKVKIYINGEQQTSFAIDNTFANVNSYINGTSTHYIGRTRSGASYMDGYLAEYHFVDGSQLTPAVLEKLRKIFGYRKNILVVMAQTVFTYHSKKQQQLMVLTRLFMRELVHLKV